MLLGKLTSEGELSGLLNIALQGLARLQGNGKFSYAACPSEVAETYLKASDPIYGFIEDKCVADPVVWTSKDELYEEFIQYCRSQNIPMIGKESFGRALKNATNIQVKSQRILLDGERVTGWRGIELNQ